jgi:hypothetical protein
MTTSSYFLIVYLLTTQGAAIEKLDFFDLESCTAAKSLIENQTLLEPPPRATVIRTSNCIAVSR